MGLRCNAAMLTDGIISQPRLPFDWTQMNVESMKQVCFLTEETSKTFWTDYFSSLDETNHHRDTNSWFPHDKFRSLEEKEKTIDKYVRRTKRLQDVLDSHIPKIFVLFFSYPELDSLEKADEILTSLKKRTKGHSKFIICNALHYETQIDDTWFIYEKIPKKEEDDDENDTYKKLTKSLEERVRKLLQEWQVELLSI